MKLALIIFSLFRLTSCVRFPYVVGHDPPQRYSPLQEKWGFNWYGPVTAGEHNWTAFGDLRKIKNDIMAHDNGYNKIDALGGQPPVPQLHREDKGHCGNFATAYTPDHDLNIQILQRLGGELTVERHTCVRIICMQNSAIFICNDSWIAIHPTTDLVADYASRIRTSCTTPRRSTSAFSGQYFDTDGWNVVVGYATCYNTWVKAPPHMHKAPKDRLPPYTICDNCVKPHVDPEYLNW